MVTGKIKISNKVEGQEQPVAHEFARLERFKDNAAWNGLDSDAKLNELRGVVLTMLKSSASNDDALAALLRSFQEADGRMHLRRDLIVAQGADIIVSEN